MEQTLLLNASYEPLKVVSWQRAMTLWAQGKCEIVSTHDKEVRAVTFSFKLPSVARLLRFVRVRRNKNFVPFTRSNIYLRDEYTCQYCGEQFKSEDLTFDHVIPASHGGRKAWDNIVTSCVPCNRRKANRTPDEAGLTLLNKPRKPAPSPIFSVTIGLRKTPDAWRSHLYWNVELDAE